MSLAKQIGSVAKTALTNAGHMNMNNEIYARILDTTVAALHLEALAPGYKECIDREAECVNRVTKSASTAQLEAKDKERDKTLHLDTYVAQLKTLNDAYKALDITRTDEYSARVKTDTTKARKATDETLDLIIQRVNAYAVLEPTEAINAFIDTVNQIFRKYKNLIAAKGGPTSPSKSDDKPYPTPDPAPDPENPGGDSESPDEI